MADEGLRLVLEVENRQHWDVIRVSSGTDRGSLTEHNGLSGGK